MWQLFIALNWILHDVPQRTSPKYPNQITLINLRIFRSTRSVLLISTVRYQVICLFKMHCRVVSVYVCQVKFYPVFMSVWNSFQKARKFDGGKTHHMFWRWECLTSSKLLTNGKRIALNFINVYNLLLWDCI